MLKEEYRKRYRSQKAQEFYDRFFCRISEDFIPYLHIRRFAPQEMVISSAVCSDLVFFLMKGKLCVIEDRIQNQPYIFTNLYPVDVVGDYELFSDMEYSYASIMAEKYCECISMPAGVYLRWISRCPEALFYRTQLLMKQLAAQAASGRQYFFMDYTSRCVSTILQYTFAEASEISRIPVTREELAGKMGCSLRTCHRIVQNLEKEGMIGLERGKITVSPKQKSCLKEFLEEEVKNI